MSLAQLQKEAVDLAIAMNSLQITITRAEYALDAGGRKKTTTTIAAQPVLLFTRFAGGSPVVDIGGKADRFVWIGLVPQNANVKWGANVVDEFTVAGTGTFRITGGMPISIEGQINGYQLLLELLA